MSAARGLTERNWRVIDRPFVAPCGSRRHGDRPIHGPRRRGRLPDSPWSLVSALSLRFVRAPGLVASSPGLAGRLPSSGFTQPPDLFVRVSPPTRQRAYTATATSGARLSLALGRGRDRHGAAIYDPNDIIFPVVIFGVVPWLAGRTIRNQTRLARELAEKAERGARPRGGRAARDRAERTGSPASCTTCLPTTSA